MTLDSVTTSFLCYHGLETRWKAVVELHDILQARGDPCHVNLASVSLFSYKVASACAMADDRHGMVHQGQNESNRTWRI